MSYPTQTAIEMPLIQVLDELGGQAAPQDIYPILETRFPELTKEDLAERLPTDPTTSKWKNLVRWARQNLVNKGELDGSTSGVWKLTDLGIKRLQNESKAVDGVEQEEEDGESGDEILKPFDPTLIRVESKPMTLGQLISRMKHDEVDLSPEFQRKGGIWTDAAQSRLIESILIRIPIPAFYFDASNEDKWVVVDGLQRLTTLKRFVITNELRLSGLEFLQTLRNKSFKELPRHFQRRIDEAQIVVFLIEKNTPPEVKFNIFKRINTGGVPLTPQEIRHALNQGPVTQLLADLAFSKEFKQATNHRIKEDRMVDRECVTRFLAFILSPAENYRATDFDSFLSDAMADINRMPQQKRDALAEKFRASMKFANVLFGNGAFRKYATRSYPINKSLFETWSVCLADLTEDEKQRILTKKRILTEKFQAICDESRFKDSISQATGDPANIKRRFSCIQKIIRDTLNAQTTTD